MGRGRWTDSDWASYAATNISNRATVDDIYTSRTLHPDLDPKGIDMRESCDSEDNPNATPLIVGLDVTGSMGVVLDAMAREGLKTLATEVYARKPIPDPHLMFMGIGDVHAGDRAPLQATQFEADIRIADQLTKIWLERGGGGNNFESYTLAWYFAAMHTKIDAFDKHRRKGILITIGDEEPTPALRAEDIERVFGYRPRFEAIGTRELLTLVSRRYEVFHLMVEQGSYFQTRGARVVDGWTKLLGERAIRLTDYERMSEVIVSLLQVLGGEPARDVVGSWSGDAKKAVAAAVRGLTPRQPGLGGIIRFQ